MTDSHDDRPIFGSPLETPVGTLQVAVNGDGVVIEILLPNRRPVYPPARRLSDRGRARNARGDDATE